MKRKLIDRINFIYYIQIENCKFTVILHIRSDLPVDISANIHIIYYNYTFVAVPVHIFKLVNGKFHNIIWYRSKYLSNVLGTFFGIELHAFYVCFCKKGYKYPVKSGVHYLGLMNTNNLH